jgi:hypothetical protein
MIFTLLFLVVYLTTLSASGICNVEFTALDDT